MNASIKSADLADGVPSAHGPRGVPGLIVVKRLVMQGFIVTDLMGERDKAPASRTRRKP